MFPNPDHLAATSAQNSPLDIADEQLMRMIQERNPKGLGLLHERYAKLLKSIIMKVLYNEAAADDLLQEVFIEIWNRAGSYCEDKGKPLGWIIILSRRRAIDNLRRRTAYNRVFDRLELETANSQHECFLDVDENVARSDMHFFLKRALAELPQAQRETIEFAFFKQMSQREIAHQTGIPLGTIKTRVELGLRKLSKSLSGFEDLI